MKTIAFCGFKIKTLTSALIPEGTIITFQNKKYSKTFISIIEALNKLIVSNKIQVFKIVPGKKEKKRIIVPRVNC